jgi:hypothetical protein
MGKRSPKQVGADEDDEHPARRLELWGSAAVGERPAYNRVACHDKGYRQPYMRQRQDRSVRERRSRPRRLTEVIGD